jgi:hypothetical protein
VQKETKEVENDREEVEYEQGERGNGEGDVQEIPQPIGEKRKEHMKEKSTHKHKKRKSIKLVAIQALTKEELEKIGDQVK